MTLVEFIGYAASFVVLLSFLMKKMLFLRTINILGCGLFVWYGFLLDSIPIIITNLAIALVNGYYLLKMQKSTTEK